MNGAGIGMAPIALMPKSIQQVLRAGPAVWDVAGTFSLMPGAAGLRLGATSSRASTAAVAGSASAGQAYRL